MTLFTSSAAYALATKESSRPAIALVTGGKSGIGKALAERIASFPFIDQVLAVSRSIRDSDVADTPKITALAADVTTEEGRAKIVETVQQLCRGEKPQGQLRFLVHGAGVIDPIKSVLDVTPEELRNAMNVNCEAPLFLTTALYPYMAKDNDDDGVAGRVLHVSSGAAHGAPPVGWSCYGISKAAFYQSFKVLEREFREKKGGRVVVGSFKPGVVDTTMQGTIRSSSADDMPFVQGFRNMKDKAVRGNVSAARPPPKGALDSPENVGFFAEYLLLGTTDEEFANKDDPNEWDIRNQSLYPKWIEPSNLPRD